MLCKSDKPSIIIINSLFHSFIHWVRAHGTESGYRDCLGGEEGDWLVGLEENSQGWMGGRTDLLVEERGRGMYGWHGVQQLLG